jgi:hypothetical protein
MVARYAIYLAPPADSALWRFGSAVLGYDAETREDVHGFAPGGFGAAEWRASTARPRTYGFHATLKAPFRLAEGRTEGNLRAGLAEMAARHTAFDAGPLVVTAMGQGGAGFVALTLAQPSAEIARLEADVVAGIDVFRAHLTEAEIAARNPAKLTPRQRDNLVLRGYPYIGPDYKLHFTLSGALDDPEPVRRALEQALRVEVGSASLAVSDLALFVQPEPGARFHVAERFPLAAR